jgi:hypothetical protein
MMGEKRWIFGKSWTQYAHGCTRYFVRGADSDAPRIVLIMLASLPSMEVLELWSLSHLVVAAHVLVLWKICAAAHGNCYISDLDDIYLLAGKNGPI